MRTRSFQLILACLTISVIGDGFCAGSFTDGVECRDGVIIVSAPSLSYPFEAIARKLEGVADIKVTIQSNRLVMSVKDVALVKSTGYSILDDAAQDSIYAWTSLECFPQASKVVRIAFRLSAEGNAAPPAPKQFSEFEKRAPGELLMPGPPWYPAQAFRECSPAVGMLLLTVSEQGFVSKAEIKVSTGCKSMDASARLGAYRAVFKPLQQNGENVSFKAEQPFEFKFMPSQKLPQSLRK